MSRFTLLNVIDYIEAEPDSDCIRGLPAQTVRIFLCS